MFQKNSKDLYQIKENQILKIMVKSVFSKSLSFKRYMHLKIEVEKKNGSKDQITPGRI